MRGHELSPTEVKSWANQLSSYWYPSFNTDLVPATGSWPDDRTEPDIKGELRGKTFPAPSIVLRGKPQGKPTYDVFIVKTSASTGAAGQPGERVKPAGEGVLKLAKTHPTPVPQPIVEAVSRSWPSADEALGRSGRRRSPRFTTSFAESFTRHHPRSKGSLVPTASCSFATASSSSVGGDLEKQRKGKNPLPVIVEFKKALEARGVDFLFVPVPAKVEVFPDEVDPKGKYLRRQGRQSLRAQIAAEPRAGGRRGRRLAPRVPLGASLRRRGAGTALPAARHALDRPRAAPGRRNHRRAHQEVSLVPGACRARAVVLLETRRPSRASAICNRGCRKPRRRTISRRR